MVDKSISKTLQKMTVGSYESFDLSKENSVRQTIYRVQNKFYAQKIKYTTEIDRKAGTIKVRRER